MKYSYWTEQAWRGVTIYLTAHPANAAYEQNATFARPVERPMPPSPKRPPERRKPKKFSKRMGPPCHRRDEWYAVLRARGPSTIRELLPNGSRRAMTALCQVLTRHASHFQIVGYQGRARLWAACDLDKIVSLPT